MSDLLSNSAAEQYQKVTLSKQMAIGMEFIESDVYSQSGDTILDLGCGTGELTAYLADLVGPEGKVVGVDPDKERLQLARLSYSGVKNLSFVEGNASNISDILPVQSFDKIFSNHVIHWIDDKQEAFRNMFACLKPGGKIFLQYVTHLPPFLVNAFKELNPENEKKLFEMFYCEPKEEIEKYYLAVGLKTWNSYQVNPGKVLLFESVKSVLDWLWSSTHGLFDLSLVYEERLQRYLAPYTDENGICCLNFGEMKAEVDHHYRLIAYKPTSF